MANVCITYRWADGDELRAEVYVEESYPDAVAEAKAQAVDAYRQALGVTTAAWDESDD